MAGDVTATAAGGPGEAFVQPVWADGVVLKDGRGVYIAQASTPSLAETLAAAARAPSRAEAELRAEVERLRAELEETQLGALQGVVACCKANDRATAAEAETARARADAVEDCFAALKALHQPFAAAGLPALQFEDTVQGRALRALAPTTDREAGHAD